MNASLAMASVDVSADLPLATNLAFSVIAGLAAMFVVRPELWRRLWFDRLDPRPAGLMRIAFGLVILVTFIDLLVPHPPLDHSIARFLFTDEGLWLTDLARKNYGGDLRSLWDPEAGFRHWTDLGPALWGRFTVLHFRSDPPFVFTLYGAMLVSVVLMIGGFRTRWATVSTFILCEMLYRYSPVFYTGGDTVIRVFLFLGMFVRWGEAYSIDALRRRRREILGGADRFPALRRIPAWPIRLMMLQLACIYCATGLLKSGPTWSEGTALYYALNLDHFYRWPMTHAVCVAQYLHVLPVMTWLVRWWEVLFPVVLVGAALAAYERDRVAGLWPPTVAWRRWLGYAAFGAAWVCLAYLFGLLALYYLPDDSLLSPERRLPVVAGGLAFAPVVCIPTYRMLRSVAPRAHVFLLRWVVGKRSWLGFGLLIHIGIDLTMNVGTFAEVMMAVYLVWLSGEQIDRIWRYLYSRAAAPGQAGRPVRAGWTRVLMAPLDRIRYRVDRPMVVVLHHPDEASVRRAALLRPWDLAGRLRFEEDRDTDPERLAVRIGDGPIRRGSAAAVILVRALPGLVGLRPLSWSPRLHEMAAVAVRWVLRQR